jgi:LysR family glycine cleavage system transcriptional activator
MTAQPPRPKLPPLTALRACEASGRLGGFAAAAAELGVSPAAITAHLKTLESALGVALFERRARGVGLTPLGAGALPALSAAFRALEAAVQDLEAGANPDQVRIAAPPDLAQLWLSPRLAGLRAQGVQGVLVPLADPLAARGRADLAVSLRAGGAEPLVAVSAPGLAAGLTPATVPGRRLMVLRGPAGDWALWARAAGLPRLKPRGPVHTDAALALEEAANGAGVLVILRVLAEAALQAGRVVVLPGGEAPSTLRLVVEPLRPLEPGSAAARALAALT